MRPQWFKRPDAGLVVGVLAVGFNLQLAIVAVGPLIHQIRADTGMSSGVAGLLQTVPFLCLGCMSLAGPAIVLRLGAERLVGWSLGVLGGATAIRMAMPSPALLLVASAPVGAASGGMSLGLSAVVKSHFPGRSGAVIGGYTAALSVGAAIAALTAVPLSHALGSWRLALALDAVPALCALPLWLRCARGKYRPRREPGRARLDLRRPLRPPAYGLRLAALFACQSLIFTGMITWVAALYRDHGWSDARAGVTTATVSLVTIPAALLVSGRSDRGDRRPWLVATAFALAVGSFGIGLAPLAAPWVWLVIFGIGTGAIFPLCLALPLDLTHSQHDAARLTAWMLGLGYFVSAASPTLAGGLRDLTGHFEVPMVVLGTIGILAAVLGSSRAFVPGGRQAPSREPAT